MLRAVFFGFFYRLTGFLCMMASLKVWEIRTQYPNQFLSIKSQKKQRVSTPYGEIN